MIVLDVRTIIFSYLITNMLCMLVVVLLWQQTCNRFAGMVFWVVDFVFQTTVPFLIVLRGSIPDWMSMVLANALAVTGAFLGYMALLRFVGKRSSQIHNYAFLILVTGVHAYLTLIKADVGLKNLNVSVGLLIMCFQCTWLLLYRTGPDMRRLTRGVGIVFAMYSLLSVVRIVEFFTNRHVATDYFHPGIFDTLVILFYQVLFILLTYNLILMFNKRLILDVKAEEEKYSKVFHMSPYAMMLSRLSDGRIIEANEGHTNMTGYKNMDIRGKTTIDLHLWARKEDRALVIDELTNKGRVKEREIQFLTKTGDTITGLFSAEVITIDNVNYILSGVNNISERKRMESQREVALEALRASEARYRSLIENANEGIYVAQDGMIRLINRAGIEMAGYSEEEITSKPFIEFVHPDDRAMARERYQKRLSGEKLEPRFTFRFITRSGDTKWLSMGAALIDFEGRPATINVVTDITARNRAEEALKLSEEKYRNIFENTIEGICQTTAEGRYISVNPALARMMGYESPEELMMCITDMGKQVFVQSEDAKRFYEIINEKGVVNSFQVQIYRKDGAIVWTSTNARAIMDSSGNISRIDSTVVDITERKMVEEEVFRLNAELEQKIAERTRALRDSQLALLNLVDDLNQSSRDLVGVNRVLEAVNKELAAFSYSVSHDLRAPLRSIDGFSQALLEDCADKLDDDGKNYLARIRQATQNMGRLIDDMLNLSRVTQSEFRQEMVDLSKIVREIINANWQEDSLEHQSFSIQENIIVRGDQRLMHIALTNLLDNAWKFASKQEHPHVEFGFIFKDGKKTIFVRDNGVGFDMKYAGKLFGAFQRLHRADEFPGTGIGLATVQRVINRHGGHIWAESEVGKGATFFFTLPE